VDDWTLPGTPFKIVQIQLEGGAVNLHVGYVPAPISVGDNIVFVVCNTVP
jgi:hypothetical protein